MSLFIRLLLFTLLVAQCAETNPGPNPHQGTGTGKGTPNRPGRGRGTPQYDNSQRTLRSSTSSVGAASCLHSQQRNQNISAGQQQINAWLTSPTQSNQQRLSKPGFSLHGQQGDAGFNELKSIMLNVQSSVTNMETRFNQFEESSNEVKESNRRLEESNTNRNSTISMLTTRVENLEEELETCKQQCERLEAQSRREYLRLYGMEETPRETWEETEGKVREYMRKDLEIDDSRISIEKAHRMSSRETPRPVIIKFPFYKHKDQVLKSYREKRKTIREAGDAAIANGEERDEIETDFRKNIHMCEDYPARVMKARNDLRPFIRKAKSEGKEAYLRYDKLIIEGDAFVYDENNETIVLVDK